MNGVMQGFLVIGVVIALGYAVGRAGLLGPTAVEVLSRVAFFIATPALLFVTLAAADVRAVFSQALVVTAASSTLTCLLYLPFGLLRRRPAGETVMGSMASGYVNAGNLGLPIAAYALGDVTAVVPVVLFQLVVLAPVFTTALDLLRARPATGRSMLLRMLVAPLRNPIALAAVAGLAVTVSGVVPPEPLMAPVKLVADLAVPAMLLAFGISLRGSARPGAGDTGPQLTAVVLLKNVVHPMLAALLGLLLGLGGHELLVVVVCAALPTAQNVFGYAVRFGRGVALARDAALTTTVLSGPMLLLVVALLG